MATAKRALVANDDPAISRVLETCLKTMGWAVDCAADAEAALETFSQRNHDVVLCDVQLGGWYGIETAHALRTLNASLQVVMVSKCPDHIELARAEGFEHCLRTPFDPTALKGLIGNPPAASVQEGLPA